MKFNVGWGITSTCNMNCKFCYSKETRKKSTDLGLNDWIKFIDENHEYIETINYGTGENSLDADFFTFIDYVRTNYPSITQSLTSNGYISEKVLHDEKLYEIYIKAIDEIDVSLDFYIEEKHNEFRGQPNAYKWALQTLDMLKKDHKKSTIVFVGFEDTMTEDNIDGLFRIAKEYDSLLRLNIYRPVASSKEINDKFILKYDTLIHILNYINDKYEVVSLSDILLGNMFVDDNKIYENTGVDSIRILPDGCICPSTYLITEEYRTKYNIRDVNVLKDLKFKDFIEAPIPKECNECPLKDKCRGGVYDRRILWNKTLKKRDPYCPFENNDELPKNRFKISKKERVSVHDGYLPTMFFKNRG